MNATKKQPKEVTPRKPGAKAGPKLDPAIKEQEKIALKEQFDLKCLSTTGFSRARLLEIQPGFKSLANISHYLNGKNALHIQHARWFSAALGVPIESFSPRLAAENERLNKASKWLTKTAGNPAIFDPAQVRADVQGGASPTRTINNGASDAVLPYTSGGSGYVPIITTQEDMRRMSLSNDADEWRGKPTHLGPKGLSPYAKAMTVFDDAMSPRVSPGDLVFLEPLRQPKAGNMVLIECGDEFMLREYVPMAAGAFEARPASPHWASLHSSQHEMHIRAVVAYATVQME